MSAATCGCRRSCDRNPTRPARTVAGRQTQRWRCRSVVVIGGRAQWGSRARPPSEPLPSAGAIRRVVHDPAHSGQADDAPPALRIKVTSAWTSDDSNLPLPPVKTHPVSVISPVSTLNTPSVSVQEVPICGYEFPVTSKGTVRGVRKSRHRVSNRSNRRDGCPCRCRRSPLRGTPQGTHHSVPRLQPTPDRRRP